MPTERAPVSNPLLLLTVAAVGFVGWVTYDATRPVAPPPAPAPPLDIVFANKVFATLHLGTPQPLVAERLRDVGAFAVEPVELSGDATVYSSRHQLHLLHPLPQAEHVGDFVPGPHVVTLVFDARQPGHPLSRVVATPAVVALPRAE